MATAEPVKVAAIFLGMGGPDSPDDIRSYLYNIFSDRHLIRLPGGIVLQKPFAWLISTLRADKVRRHYELIGGKSPLLQWTRSQAEQVEKLIADDYGSFRSYVGMRYFKPMISDTVRQAYADGARRFVFVPMYPQYSAATTGSSFRVAKKAIARLKDVEATYIDDFHDDPGYVQLLNRYIKENIGPDDTLLFSAHALPQKLVDEGDPYVDQVRTTARLAAGEREYFVSFQSRTGPVKWVEPDTIATARKLFVERPGNLFVVPISFVCDHIETLYEIDIELKNLLGCGDRLKRMPMFNDDPEFAAALAQMVKSKLEAGCDA